jgi:hypothetical protein
MNKRLLSALILAALGGTALAKLPAPDPAAKAKADETSAKAAWQAKVDAFQLCKSQDKIAARFGGKGNGAGKAKAAPAAASAASAQASAPAAAASTQAAASAPAMGASAGTPVAYAPPPPCADPGPFAYNPPEQKPLETSGAHSPSGTAASPPSVNSEAGKMAPDKKP